MGRGFGTGLVVEFYGDRTDGMWEMKRGNECGHAASMDMDVFDKREVWSER